MGDLEDDVPLPERINSFAGRARVEYREDPALQAEMTINDYLAQRIDELSAEYRDEHPDV